MNELLQSLLKLQALDFEEVTDENADATIAELRAKIPPQILGHYDRLVARGKKGVAMIRGQVCSGCHMTVPVGAIMTLKRGDDIQLCENCGRYLYLPAAKPESVEPGVGEKPAKKTRKPKKTSLAA